MVKQLQVACIVCVSLGIVIELWMKADLGYLLITIGSLAFAVATKIHALEEREKRRQ